MKIDFERCEDATWRPGVSEIELPRYSKNQKGTIEEFGRCAELPAGDHMDYVNYLIRFFDNTHKTVSDCPQWEYSHLAIIKNCRPLMHMAEEDFGFGVYASTKAEFNDALERWTRVAAGNRKFGFHHGRRGQKKVLLNATRNLPEAELTLEFPVFGGFSGGGHYVYTRLDYDMTLIEFSIDDDEPMDDPMSSCFSASFSKTYEHKVIRTESDFYRISPHLINLGLDGYSCSEKQFEEVFGKWCEMTECLLGEFKKTLRME